MTKQSAPCDIIVKSIPTLGRIANKTQPTEENQCNDNVCLTQDTVCKTESESSCDN